MELFSDTDMVDAAIESDFDEDNFDVDFDVDMADMAFEDPCVEAGPAVSMAASKTFLDLPEKVRVRIYEYYGLVRSCPVDVVYEKGRSKNHNRSACLEYPDKRDMVGNWNTTFGARNCDHPPLPLDIFLVSHAVYRDAFSTFYSKNKFTVFLRRRSDLVTFRISAARGLKHIRSIHVDLQTYDNRTIKADMVEVDCHRACLNLWRSFSQVIATGMPRLRYFSIKCRVKDPETAMAVVENLEDFPALAGCSFYFNALPLPSVISVARDAAEYATTVVKDTSEPFPFLKLPKELQLMVWRHLLVVRWDPFIHSSKACAGLTTFQSHKCERAQDTSYLMCCGTCSMTGATCFCSYGQTALSSTCSCFRSPLPYFLVNREMYEDASGIFYTSNRFAFIQENPDQMMRFLHPFSNATLAKIRYLIVKFPPAHRSFGSPAPKLERSLQLSWSILLRFFKEHFCMDRLSLTIVDLGTLGSPLIRSERNGYLRRFFQVFSALRGIHSFQVYLLDDHEYESTAEQIVMGPGYVSVKSNDFPFLGHRCITKSRT
ncbi:hypothetical protein DTO164E3_2378 [Paecilomyces variotii]|nr:hypothetical protein DTO164E3_2378 [Paecilomyces variotii]KAJ9206797.1 hypothetical protein DTO032I3_1385 [Paecilomyces variotii]KAJ9274378.1 hypothetical protein DTO021D3_8742 [Paecilomyces variotii]KAJ9290327.1 hypothetical protein DTO021C3_1951 [Paecilomyces variotii]KAJ9346569.1 hypothetical protein DTO027B6_823 [Paecilomyces variotii]